MDKHTEHKSNTILFSQGQPSHINLEGLIEELEKIHNKLEGMSTHANKIKEVYDDNSALDVSWQIMKVKKHITTVLEKEDFSKIGQYFESRKQEPLYKFLESANTKENDDFSKIVKDLKESMDKVSEFKDKTQQKSM